MKRPLEKIFSKQVNPYFSRYLVSEKLYPLLCSNATQSCDSRTGAGTQIIDNQYAVDFHFHIIIIYITSNVKAKMHKIFKYCLILFFSQIKKNYK